MMVDKKDIELLLAHGDQVFSALPLHWYQYVTVLATLISLVNTFNEIGKNNSTSIALNLLILIAIYLIGFFMPALLSRQAQEYYDKRYELIKEMAPDALKLDVNKPIKKIHDEKKITNDSLFLHIYFFIGFLILFVAFGIALTAGKSEFIIYCLFSVVGLGASGYMIYTNVKNPIRIKEEAEIKKPKTELKTTNSISTLISKRWFIFAVLLFFVLWWQFLNFYPVNKIETQPNLPSPNYKIAVNNDSYFLLSCSRGQMFETRIVQEDMLECQIRAENINKSIIESGFTLSVYSAQTTGNTTIGETIPSENYQKNRRFYSVTLNSSDFNNGIAPFLIKVPPTRKISFFIQDLKGYNNLLIPLEFGLTTTKYEEYLQSTLPQVQFFLLLFGIFGAVKYIRDLFENK